MHTHLHMYGCRETHLHTNAEKCIHIVHSSLKSCIIQGISACKHGKQERVGLCEGVLKTRSNTNAL